MWTRTLRAVYRIFFSPQTHYSIATWFSLSVVVYTSASITHNYALNPLTLLQTVKMDAYTVESMKLKGRV